MGPQVQRPSPMRLRLQGGRGRRDQEEQPESRGGEGPQDLARSIWKLLCYHNIIWYRNKNDPFGMDEYFFWYYTWFRFYDHRIWGIMRLYGLLAWSQIGILSVKCSWYKVFPILWSVIARSQLRPYIQNPVYFEYCFYPREVADLGLALLFLLGWRFLNTCHKIW